MATRDSLVWTARVVKLRVDAKVGIKREASLFSVAIFLAFIAIVLTRLNYSFIDLVSLNVCSEDINYINFWALAAINISWLIFIAGHHAVIASATRLSRQTWEWLLSTELGVMTVDPAYQGAIFQSLEHTIIKKWITPPPPRNLEEQLDWAAINAELLVQMSREGIEVVAGRCRGNTWGETSRFSVINALIPFGMLSVFLLWFSHSTGSPVYHLFVILPVIFYSSITSAAHTKNSRLTAICDFLLEDTSAEYLQGWSQVIPPQPKPPLNRKRPDDSVADMMRRAAAKAERDRRKPLPPFEHPDD